MKAIADSVIRSTAISLGISQVMDKPDKTDITMPLPRIEITWLPEELSRSFKRIARLKPQSDQVTIRSRVYQRSLRIRAEVVSDNEEWLEAFIPQFLADLPSKIADENGNLVTVRAVKAERQGYGTRLVEVFKKRVASIHITVSGMVCNDQDIPLITDVNIVNGTDIQNF